MRSFNIFSLVVMIVTALMTINSMAASEPADARKIHILQNLDAASMEKVVAVLKKRGYVLSRKPIFSESDSTLIFTRTDANEVDTPSIKFEIVMKSGRALPRTVYEHTAASGKVEDLLEPLAAIPNPDHLREYKIGSR